MPSDFVLSERCAIFSSEMITRQIARRAAVAMAAAAVSIEIYLNDFDAGKLLILFALTGGTFVATRHFRSSSPHILFLPLMRVLGRFAGPGLALAAVLVLAFSGVFGDLAAHSLLLSYATGLVLGQLSQSSRPSRRNGLQRIAVVGSEMDARVLSSNLFNDRITDVAVAGWIDPHEVPSLATMSAPLGQVHDVGKIVVENEIDLLLIAPDAPRLHLFEQISSGCLHLPVRMMELSAFYERRFGRVPLASINAAWFQYLMHPHYEPSTPAVKRVIDLAIAAPALLVLAPVIAVLMTLIKRDGDDALFRQRRVGERGHEFEILKLRSMRMQPLATQQQWSSKDDPRITPIGRFIRKTHLDEAPQLINVIRGDMSIVGPRPEQPAFVSRLEESIPFYSRRHLVRPGLTGWAQVIAGYCGSDGGSAIKTCYDLYYLKHRSPGLDVLIMGETLRTLVADRQWQASLSLDAFVPEYTGVATNNLLEIESNASLVFEAKQ